MWIFRRGLALGAVVAVLGTAVGASADNNPNGITFRAVGWFKGKGEITDESIKCETPTLGSAIADGTFALGLWNTYGFDTLYFPDINGPFSNPCGGWLQLQNLMLEQAIIVERVDLRYRIPGARRFRELVPTRNGFPLACRQFRRETLYVGNRLDPVNSDMESSGSGAPNVAFIQLVPLVTPQLIHCLRSQYAALPTTLYASLPLVIRATAHGIADAGDRFRSNTIAYTLNLRHTCGNGRVDDGEMCDPTATGTTCLASCVSGICEGTSLPCTTSADCVGTCLPGNDPSECTCVF